MIIQMLMALEEVTGELPWLWEAIQSPPPPVAMAATSDTDGWQWCAITIIGLIAVVGLAGHYKDDR